MADRVSDYYRWASQKVSGPVWYLPEEAREALAQARAAVARAAELKPVRGKLTAAKIDEVRANTVELLARTEAAVGHLREPFQFRQIEPAIYAQIRDDAIALGKRWRQDPAHRRRWQERIVAELGDGSADPRAAIIEAYLNEVGLSELSEEELRSPREVLHAAAAVVREAWPAVREYADDELAVMVEDVAARIDLEAEDAKWDEWTGPVEVQLTEQDRAELARVSTQDNAQEQLADGLERKFLQRRGILIEIRRREREKERARLAKLGLEELAAELAKGALNAESLAQAWEWQLAAQVAQMTEVPRRSTAEGLPDVTGPWARLWLDAAEVLALETADDAVRDRLEWLAGEVQARLPGGGKARAAATREPFRGPLQ